jgi:DNA-binding CsgD family transcriptional regulator
MADGKFVELSKAERDVMVYVEQGISNKDIGDKLFVCEKTVKFHLTNIYKKYEVKSRSELIAKLNGTGNQSWRVAVMSTSNEKPLGQGARQVQVVNKSQEDKIMFINDHFKVGETLDHLHKMMKDVTKQELNHNTVNAACNCVARLNETINTAIQAAKFLNER